MTDDGIAVPMDGAAAGSRGEHSPVPPGPAAALDGVADPAARGESSSPAGTARVARGRALAAAWWPTAFGFALAVLVAFALVRVGFVDDYGNTLQVMGFDPDRAALLTSLLLGAIAAALVAIVGGRFPVAVVTGAGVILAAFYPVFREETRAAMRSRGADGTFDLIGWGLSALTLVTFALLVGWAAAVLGRDVSSRLAAVRHSAADILGRRGRRVRSTGHLAAAAIVLAVLAVTGPLFGDMLNFDPDAHMRQGAPAGVSLFGGTDAGGGGTASGGSGTTAGGGAAAPTDSPGPSGAAPTAIGPRRSPDPTSPLVIPSDLVAGPVEGSYVTANALGTDRPWSTHPPTGGGRTLSVNLPAPWTGGIRDYATIDIYLPPGYDGSSGRYPVIYEPHQPLWAWEQGMHVVSLLDTLIRSGEIPPEIVVFVGQYGGPYADSECADSADGREWFDRYLGVDVPAYVDGHFRTIPTAAARSLLGFSSGGYCAAAAITHHPDVFSTAMIFSGYYQAGIRTSTTPVAGRPWNDDPALEAKVSPILLVPQIPAALRSQLFMTFSADPANHFYGEQITAFSKVLDSNGVSMAILPDPLGHSWAAVREQLPGVLSLLAARQVRLGVFKGP